MNERPLAGVRVLELGHSVAAPYAGQVLGDLGAQVVKVEKAAGDDARKWGPPFLDGASATFQSLNRNKRSVVCDLRDRGHREALLAYVRDHVDVVVQNLRPGQADEIGLGAAAMTAMKPSLVYCNMGAFGAKGPLARSPGYDPLMQAFGGIMSVVGEQGRPPVRVGPSIMDMGTALWAVVGVVSALYRRRETGIGGIVDVDRVAAGDDIGERDLDLGGGDRYRDRRVAKIGWIADGRRCRRVRAVKRGDPFRELEIGQRGSRGWIEIVTGAGVNMIRIRGGCGFSRRRCGVLRRSRRDEADGERGRDRGGHQQFSSHSSTHRVLYLPRSSARPGSGTGLGSPHGCAGVAPTQHTGFMAAG